jgi:tetratricopeptide (TPR) repeat protein
LPKKLNQQEQEIHDRWLGNIQWDDPREWLRKALVASGEKAAALEALVPAQGRSGRAQAVADLAMYEEAEKIFVRLIGAGRDELRPKLAELYAEKAFVHRYVDDLPGTLSLYDRAIAIWETLAHKEGQGDQAPALATAYENKAIAVEALGDLASAMDLYDRAIALREQLMTILSVVVQEKHEAYKILTNNLARSYLNKAIAFSTLKEHARAVELCDRAIAIRERLVNQEGWRELAQELANCYLCKAKAASELGDLDGALLLCDQSIAIWERMVKEEGRAELESQLTEAARVKANLLRQKPPERSLSEIKDFGFEPLLSERRDNLRGSIAILEDAIVELDRLVNREGRQELTEHLAESYVEKAHIVRSLGDLPAAVPSYDQGIAILEGLVFRRGRPELAVALAAIYVTKSDVVRQLHDPAAAAALCDQAISILERLVHQQGRSGLADELARAYMKKASAVTALGDRAAAMVLCDQALALRK